MTPSIRILDRFGRKVPSFLSRRHRDARRPSPDRRWRPNVDLLEDRTVLSPVITVNSLLDQVDPSGSPTVTLRDAIGEANGEGGATIEFAPGLASQNNPGFGTGVIALSIIADANFGVSAFTIRRGQRDNRGADRQHRDHDRAPQQRRTCVCST